MPVTTLWGLLVTAILLIVGGVFFWLWIVAGTARELRDFRRWTTLTAIASAVLVLFSAIPFDAGPLKDAAITTNTVGPLALTISVTLASIFYSAGEWFDVFQRFRLLGIKGAKADRQGRQVERNLEWQNRLRSTKNRVVISGVTLGGWFVTSWEDTSLTLLEILRRQAKVQVFLADPTKSGFRSRADDPGELAEAISGQQASQRAKEVYHQIARVFEHDQFQPHLAADRLSFHVYAATPLSIVWIDDDIHLTPYLPCVSDKACPEFTIGRLGQMGTTITSALEQLLRHSRKITTAEDARTLADQCQPNA